MLPPITAVYDRAALIALPAELRQSYTRHLTDLLVLHCQLLLIVYDSPNQADKPPYPVSRTEIEKIFAGFSITELEKIINPLLPVHLGQQGYSRTNMAEIIYQLEYTRKLISKL